MNNTKFLLVSICLMPISVALYAQKSTFDSLAVWLPYGTAYEKFSYRTSDTLRLPDGDYVWKINRETANVGTYELASIHAKFKNGVPDGEFEFISYKLSFGISDFDPKTVKAATYGTKMYAKGRFEKGKAVGNWRFEQGDYAHDGQISAIQWNATTNQWRFQQDSISVIGRLNAEGYLQGTWNWTLGKQIQRKSTYEKGILTKASDQNKPLFNAELREINAPISTDQPLVEPLEHPWIWQNGFDKSDSLWLWQVPFANWMEWAMLPYNQLAYYLDQHPLFSFPPIKGTAQVKYPLPKDTQEQLEALHTLAYQKDSTIKHWINLPLFRLRRMNNSQLDSTLIKVENQLVALNAFTKYGIWFISDSARLVAPRYLKLASKPQELFKSSQEFIGKYSEDLNELLKQISRSKEQLAELKELLREQGAIEELEEEWTLLHHEIEQKLIPEIDNAWFSALLDTIISNDYQDRSRHYHQLNTLQDRQVALKASIELYQYLHETLSNRTYRLLFDAPAEFIKEYTQFWYNPYMGVNNVEVLVKKRMITKIANEVWPYWIEELNECKDLPQLRTKLEQLKNYRLGILQLDTDKSVTAKRFENRIIKERNLDTTHLLMQQYLESQN